MADKHPEHPAPTAPRQAAPASAAAVSSQDESALDAQVAEMSEELNSDLGGSVDDGAASALDEALFAAAPAVTQSEADAAMNDPGDPRPGGDAKNETAADPGPEALDDVLEQVSQELATATEKADEALRLADGSGLEQIAATPLESAADEPSAPASSATAPMVASAPVEAASAPNESEPPPHAEAEGSVEGPTPNAAGLPDTPATATGKPAAEPTIEELDTHLAAKADQVLEEAQQAQAEQAAGPPTEAASAVAPAEAAASATGADANGFDDSAFAPPPTLAGENTISDGTPAPSAHAQPAEPQTAAVASSEPPAAIPAAQSKPGVAPASATDGAANANAKSAPAAAPAPGTKPAAPAKAPAPAPAPKPKVPLSKRLEPAAVVAAKPLVKVSERLSPKLRHTLGLVGLITLFNACALWAFLLLRTPGGEVGPAKNPVPFLRPGDPAPAHQPDEDSNGSGASHGEPAKAKEGGGHAEPKADAHGAAKPSAKDKKTASAKTGKSKSSKKSKPAADAHGGGGH